MKVEIYGKVGCDFCDRSKFLCEMKGIEYQYYTLGLNYDVTELTARLGFAVRSMPQIFVDDKHVGGYDALKEKLG